MRRMRFLQAAVFVSFMLLVTGLFFFQVVQGDTYVKLASQNRLRILRILPPRGSIRKVDKDRPTMGLAGATIRITGIDNNFTYEGQTVEAALSPMCLGTRCLSALM